MLLGRIAQAPLAYPRVHGETRRALVRRFPYAIYFHAMPDEIAAEVGDRGPRSRVVEVVLQLCTGREKGEY